MSGILGPHKPEANDFSAFVNPASNQIDIGADIYLMMESDVRKWCEHWGIEQLAAVDFLAQIESRINDFSAQLKTKLDEVGITVVSATSFVPEISNINGRGDEDYTRTNWGKALIAIFQIAHSLQSHRNQTVVQMVAGSVLDQFRVAKRDGASRFSVRTRERTSLITLVLDRLSQCLEASHEKGVNTDRLRIALELEPGPLYLLQNRKSLEEFSRAIDGHRCGLVRKCVGFNLDIAHWWLCRDLITQDDVAVDVRQKIFGAHIAGHSARGHFGDLSLTKLVARAQLDRFAQEQLDAYQMWLRFLADDSSTPNAAGHISLEFEAAKPSEDVSPSLQLLRDWVDPTTTRSDIQI
jgi:sugar phosphate isomerase/epimerase